MSIHIHSYTGGHVFTNGYLIETEQAIIAVDAPANMLQWAQTMELTPTHLLLTHQHFDHVEDVEVIQATGAHIRMHSEYNESLVRQKEARENWGLPIQITPFHADELLAETASITIANLEFQISHVPGHSPDSITFYCAQLGCLFAGDTLMAGGTGRTDLPGGSTVELFTGIQTHLFSLPESTKVYSGHGPTTTIGVEKQSNPVILNATR